MRARACEPTRFDAASIGPAGSGWSASRRSEEHTSELQSRSDLVCRLLLEKKKKNIHNLREEVARRRAKRLGGRAVIAQLQDAVNEPGGQAQEAPPDQGEHNRVVSTRRSPRHSVPFSHRSPICTSQFSAPVQKSTLYALSCHAIVGFPLFALALRPSSYGMTLVLVFFFFF